MIPLTSDSDSPNFLPLNLNSMSPASKGITLFAHSRSVISEIFSWKPFKIHYISSCSKNVPTRARQTFSIGKYTTNKGGSLEKIRGSPTEN